MTPVQKLFGFQGRVRRRDYWVYSILIALGSIVVVAMAILGLGVAAEDKNLSTGLWLLMLWPNLAISTKRLHDRNLSGWYCAPMLIAPAAIQEVGDRLSLSPLVTLLLNVPALVLLVWAIVELGFRDTVPGTNRFGPSPKASPASAPVASDGPALPGGDVSA